MNTLTIYALIAIALIGIAVALWLYRRGKAEGARQQEDKNRENTSDYLEENVDAWYDGRIGTDALPVLNDNKWGEGAPANSGVRVEPGKGNGSKRKNDSGEVPNG